MRQHATDYVSEREFKKIDQPFRRWLSYEWEQWDKSLDNIGVSASDRACLGEVFCEHVLRLAAEKLAGGAA